MPRKPDLSLSDISGIMQVLMHLAIRLAPADARGWLLDMRSELFFVPAGKQGRWVLAALALALRLRIKALFAKKKYLGLSLASLVLVTLALLWLPTRLVSEQPAAKVAAPVQTEAEMPVPMAAAPSVAAVADAPPMPESQRMAAADSINEANARSEESLLASIPDSDNVAESLGAELDFAALSVLVIADDRLMIEILEDTTLTLHQGRNREPEHLIFSRPVFTGERLEFELPLTLHVADAAAVRLSTATGQLELDVVGEVLLALETD